MEPVIEESDILNSSQSSSMLQCRREAAGGALGHLSPESSLERSNLDPELEVIAQRNEHERGACFFSLASVYLVVLFSV